MATVNIIQPTVGSLQLVSPIPSAYTVRFVPPAGEYTRGPIRLYCEACGQTLLESSDNPATFNIESLVSGGHPGPFDISVTVSYDYLVEIHTYSDPVEAGTATPQIEIRPIGSGGSASFSIQAVPNEGWMFSNWTCLETGWTSTNASTTYRVTNVTGDVVRTLYAHFVRLSYPVNLYATRGSSADRVFSYDYQMVGDRTVWNVSDTLSRYQIATLRSCGNHYAGESVTITCEFTPEGIENGYKFICWKVNGSFVRSASYTFTMEARLLNCEAIISTNETVRQYVVLENKLYGYFSVNENQISEGDNKDGRVIGFDRAVYPDGSRFYGGRSAIEFLYPMGMEFSLYLHLYKNGSCPAKNMTIEARYAVIHGASRPKPWTADTDGQTLYIFMCAHLLRRNDSGSILTLNSGLIADCNVRSGSPVYPVN